MKRTSSTGLAPEGRKAMLDRVHEMSRERNNNNAHFPAQASAPPAGQPVERQAAATAAAAASASTAATTAAGRSTAPPPPQLARAVEKGRKALKVARQQRSVAEKSEPVRPAVGMTPTKMPTRDGPYVVPVIVPRRERDKRSLLKCEQPGCSSYILAAPVGPLARTLAKCTQCGTVMCDKCGEDHFPHHQRHAVMLCETCGTVHPPSELLCDYLWCEKCCGQSHAGKCLTEEHTCEHCAVANCDHNTSLCPFAPHAFPEQEETRGNAPLNPSAAEAVPDLFSTLLGSTDSGKLLAAAGPVVQKREKAVEPKLLDKQLKLSWLRCIDCDAVGHVSCDTTRKEPSFKMCFKCFEQHHTTANCPHTKPKEQTSK